MSPACDRHLRRRLQQQHLERMRSAKTNSRTAWLLLRRESAFSSSSPVRLPGPCVHIMCRFVSPVSPFPCFGRSLASHAWLRFYVRTKLIYLRRMNCVPITYDKILRRMPDLGLTPLCSVISVAPSVGLKAQVRQVRRDLSSL